MQELVKFITQALVDRPELVELLMSEGEGATLFELKVAPEDVGKVIGRDGRTIHAVRTVLAAAALKQGKKARLEILEK